ncbi:MAG TPA: hypothetical protein VHE30_22420 [Polyangiaceae bacterium]|nr:hypothetical protein [Polyangiaceae bacterium]
MIPGHPPGAAVDAPPASRAKLAAPTELEQQLEPLHEASTHLVLLTILPAIQVAWADGTVQERERRLILELAEREGLTADAAAMAKVHRWLAAPPPDHEIKETLTELRALLDAKDGDPELLEKVVGWARDVAAADGGVLGLGAVGSEEKRMIGWLESTLEAEDEVSGAPSIRSRPAAGGLPGLSVMRELLLERLASTFEHAHLVPADANTMWPRPCPRHPGEMPPAVFAVPEDEYREFSSKILNRYIRSLTLGVPHALRVATRHAVAPMDDRELARIVWETPFSRLLVPTLDPVDVTRFGSAVAEAEALGRPHKLDVSHLSRQTPLPDVTMAPTVALFAVRDDGLRVVAIAVAGRTFRPEDGESWARARYFLLQGCSLALVAGIHSTLHFPMDSVIGVTREVLPGTHPVARVVEAHAYLELPLDYGVRWNPRSVAANNQAEIYTPFPTPGEGNFRGFADYHAGLEGNSAYPPYRFPLEPPAFPGPYCEFLRAYYDVVLAFCRRVAENVDPTDPALERWAAALHGFLPGFPSSAALADREVLARALAGFVHTGSVWHSAEHHVYGELPVRVVPQRLRIPAPTGNDVPIPTDQWVRSTDVFRQEMARRMFYEAHTVRSILEVDYGFETTALRDAAADFAVALRECDGRVPKRFMPLDRIACSIQF